MVSLKEYLQFANDCLRWAAQAETEDQRTAMLKMARIWTEAALRLQGIVLPQIEDRLRPPKHRKGRSQP